MTLSLCWWWCKVIFMSTPSFVMLGWVELMLDGRQLSCRDNSDISKQTSTDCSVKSYKKTIPHYNSFLFRGRGCQLHFQTKYSILKNFNGWRWNTSCSRAGPNLNLNLTSTFVLSPSGFVIANISKSIEQMCLSKSAFLHFFSSSNSLSILWKIVKTAKNT